MPEIKHNFTGGKMNKDLDERLIPKGEYRDAMNVQVSTSEASEVGTVQNILGNSEVLGQTMISPNAVCVGGKIHFSSNISGKTIVLDYISDSLGSEKEMQVHKFAEEAMYKWIAYAVLSTRINIPEYIVNRFKKERFAETRKAKLRLSNIKLEEITQILRGKSKQIKH